MKHTRLKRHTAAAPDDAPTLLPRTAAVWWLSFLASLLPLSLIAFSVHAQQVPAGDAAKGKTIAMQSCAACHGEHGNSTDTRYPSLAGQGAHYLYEQLQDFSNGKRQNAVMNAIVTTLSDDDMHNLASYYSIQQPVAATPPSKAPNQRGEQIYHDGIASKSVPACATCHGADGAGRFPQYPRLAGQQAPYVAAQLKAFRSQQRGNNPTGIMESISANLSDAEIDAVSRYVAGMGP